MISSLGRWRWLALVIPALLLGGVWLAGFRTSFQYTLPQTENPLGVYVDGVGNLETSPDEPIAQFRWLNAYTELRLPPVGRTSYRLDLVVHNTVADTPRTLHILANDQTLAHIALRPGWQALAITVPPLAAAPKLVLITDPPLDPARRSLGVALGGLRLRQLAPSTVPLSVIAQLGLIAMLVGCLGVIAGVRRWWRMVLALGLVAALTVALVPWRFGTLIALSPLVEALLWAIPLGVVLRLASWRWVRGSDQGWLAGVRLIALCVFALRVWGLWHPQFREVDHLLRTHQIEKIAHGQAGEVAQVLGHQFEWGSQVQVPYSLWAYYPFVPFAVLQTGQLKALVEAVTAALDASIVLLLFRIVQCADRPAQQGWWTAIAYAVLPIGFLYHHDGSFPTIIGLWMVVVTVAALQQLALKPSWRWFTISMITLGLSVLLYITHLVFVPLFTGVYVAGLWIMGGKAQRRAAYLSAGALAGGVVLAIGMYYGRALPAVIRTTVPALWQTFRSVGSVGRTQSALPTGLLGSFAEQVWGHFRVVGLVLAGLGLWWEAQRGSQLRSLAIAYGVFIVATALLDTQFGLWNKHWYFALPGIALLAGSGLFHLGQQRRVGVWAANAIVGYLLIASLNAWLLRVVWYQATLRTL